MERYLPRDLSFEEYNNIELLFEPPMRSENAYHLWEHFDKLARQLETVEDRAEKFRLFPLLDKIFAGKFANGVFSAEQITRLIEMYFLDIEKTQNKTWTPIVLLVPYAHCKNNEIKVEYKLIFDRSQSKNSYNDIKPYLKICSDFCSEAILQWMLQKGLYEPLKLSLPFEDYIVEPKKNGVLVHESHFFEYELKYLLFNKPLQEEGFGFTGDHAKSYCIPQFISSIIENLKNEEFCRPVVESLNIKHIYKKPVFIQKIDDGLHILKPFVIDKKNNKCDLAYHYIIQTFILIYNWTHVLKKLLPQKLLDYIEILPSFSDLTDKPLSELYRTVQLLLEMSLNVININQDKSVELQELFRDITGQINLLNKLHNEVDIYHMTRLNILEKYCISEMTAFIGNAFSDLVVVGQTLFNPEHYDEAGELEKRKNDILNIILQKKGILHIEKDNVHYFAAEKNIFRIYAILKNSAKKKHEKIAYQMMGELSNRTGKDIKDLLSEHDYSKNEVDTFKKALIKKSGDEVKDNENSNDKNVSNSRIVVIGTIIGVSILLTLIGMARFPELTIIMIGVGLIALVIFKMLKRLMKNRRTKIIVEEERKSFDKSVLSLSSRKEIRSILAEYVPSEVISRVMIFEVIKKNILVNYFPIVSEEESYIGTIVNDLVRNDILLELRLSNEVAYYVFPEFWDDPKVRGSFEKEIKRLFIGNTIDYNQYRLGTSYCHNATNAIQLKKIMKNGM